jgi:hypothetical protein
MAAKANTWWSFAMALVVLASVIYVNLYTGNAASESILVPGVKILSSEQAAPAQLVINPDTLIACANNGTGVVRLITNGRCDSKKERPIVWTVPLALTDRIVFKLYAKRIAGAQDIPLVIYFNAHEHASNVQTTITTGYTGATGAKGERGEAGNAG